MATDYMTEGAPERPGVTPHGSGDCPGRWSGYCCTRALGHAGQHIADGIFGRCADWDDEESE